jgi:hypothetical protein
MLADFLSILGGVGHLDAHCELSSLFFKEIFNRERTEIRKNQKHDREAWIDALKILALGLAFGALLLAAWIAL